MRHSSWILLGVVLAGCQAQSTPAPVATASKTVADEVLPPALAALLEEPDYEVALSKIDKLIAQQPKDAALYSVRSSIHHRRSRHEAAIADLDQAIALKGQDARLYNNRGFVKLGLQQFNASMADFDRATELAPDYANPFNNRGLLLIARGQYASAVEQLDEALRRDPNYVDAYNNRGFAALQGGQIDRALADFNMAIKLNPKYVNAYNNRGLLQARVGDLDNAIVDFTEAMIIDPMNPKYYQHRREVYLRQSAIDLALADEARHDWLTRLKELNGQVLDRPGDANAIVERAKHYLTVDDQTAAMKDLDRALVLDAGCVSAIMEHGRICIRQKHYTEALADAAKLLQIAPSQDAFSLSGDAYLGLKNFDKAIESYTEARRIDSSVAEAYYHKSRILQASGQQDEAESHLQRAVALDPDVESRLR
jgi:tetratricopeptide (TPR) repeat protein